LNGSASRDILTRFGHDNGHVEDLSRDELNGRVLGGTPDEQDAFRGNSRRRQSVEAVRESTQQPLDRRTG
jgi:hypothetical protein